MEQRTVNREKIIVRTSVIGIVANLFLAGFKAAVGLLSNSIAVVLDAVNNLSDALSSVITIVGTKLAAKKPDKKHPLGYGRIENLSAMIVAAIVLYAGITSLVESVKKIIHPETPDYSVVSLIIIAAAVAVKIVLGLYVQRKGKQVNSGSLSASGSDALFDAILSASVLVCAIVFKFFRISLEAYVGAIISVFIIKSGLEMLIETLDEILGKRPEADFANEIKKTIASDPCVNGAYDLILHSYGPDNYIGSVHVEIPDTMTAEQIDEMEHRITQNVFKTHGVILGGIGIYSVNTQDPEVQALRQRIVDLVTAHEGVLQLHGFHADPANRTVRFDLILDYAMKDRQQSFLAIADEVQRAFPDYTMQITPDIDI